jgi:hypothetical protein
MENLSDAPNLPMSGAIPPRVSSVILNAAALPLDRAMAQDAELVPELQALAQNVQALAHQAAGNSTQLLALLRVLESLHREICDGAFQQSLPNNRQTLYSLLRDIEAQGGWPHIPRLKLQRLLAVLESAETGSESEPGRNS